MSATEKRRSMNRSAVKLDMRASTDINREAVKSDLRNTVNGNQLDPAYEMSDEGSSAGEDDPFDNLLNERASSQMVRAPVEAVKRPSQFIDTATIATLASTQEETKGPARSAPVSDAVVGSAAVASTAVAAVAVGVGAKAVGAHDTESEESEGNRSEDEQVNKRASMAEQTRIRKEEEAKDKEIAELREEIEEFERAQINF